MSRAQQPDELHLRGLAAKFGSVESPEVLCWVRGLLREIIEGVGREEMETVVVMLTDVLRDAAGFAYAWAPLPSAPGGRLLGLVRKVPSREAPAGEVTEIHPIGTADDRGRRCVRQLLARGFRQTYASFGHDVDDPRLECYLDRLLAGDVDGDAAHCLVAYRAGDPMGHVTGDGPEADRVHRGLLADGWDELDIYWVFPSSPAGAGS